MRFAPCLLPLLALLAPVAGRAEPPAPPVTEAPVAQTSVAQTPVDPARLVIADRIARKVLPDGSYRRVMSGLGDRIAAMMTARSFDIPLREFAQAGGMSAEQREKLGPGTLAQIMAIIDPAFDERQKIMTQTMFAGLAEQLAPFEPEMRKGMAEAYARRFDTGQLAAIDAFFATPTGTAYAAEALEIANDPAVASRMQALMPAMLKTIPALVAKATAATANLPPPRKLGDLNPAQCAEIGRLLGLPNAGNGTFACGKSGKTPTP